MTALSGVQNDQNEHACLAIWDSVRLMHQVRHSFPRLPATFLPPLGEVGGTKIIVTRKWKGHEKEKQILYIVSDSPQKAKGILVT